jgi:hypothetical protein
MLILLLVFFGVFFCRDVQILAMQGPAFGSRFAIYALFQTAGMAMAAAWPMPRFAWAGVLIQLAELAVAVALARWASGRFSWIGWMLPSPAFLLTLYGFSLAVQRVLLHLELYRSLAMVTVVWLVLAGGAGLWLSSAESTPEDRRFVSDLAMMTSCTALVFIPLGLA